MTKIYMLVSNNGDGSGSTHFFKDTEENIKRLIDEDPETWGGNDSLNFICVNEDLMTLEEMKIGLSTVEKELEYA